MANIVVASLNVTFGEEEGTDGTEGQLKLEIDDRADGLNGGDTSFAPGDDVYFFRFSDSNVSVLEQFSTAGGISPSGTADKAVDENITFANSDTGSLSYPPSGSVSLSWLGRCYEIQTDGSVSPNTTLPEVTRSNLKMAGGKKVAGILRAEYSSAGSLFKLSGVPVDFEEISLFAIGSYP